VRIYPAYVIVAAFEMDKSVFWMARKISPKICHRPEEGKKGPGGTAIFDR
jgi:hypothetical protein